MNSASQLSTSIEIGARSAGSAWLAPMSGVTDVVFRRISARFGAGLVVTEMVACEPLVAGSQEASLRAAGEGIGVHVVQLVGRDPVAMGEAARMAEAAGAAIVDINFGCPSKKVVGGNGGSSLMREPALARSIVASVVRAVACPVTVKMRLGWDSASLNAAAMARDAVDVGAQAVTVHGRTRQQFYEGHADWRAIASVVEAVPVPVVANGDIASIEDARTCLRASAATGVMIGRAALGRPWLVGQIEAGLAGRPFGDPAPDVRVAAAIEHYEGLLTLYGHAVGVRHARKHLAAYAETAERDGYALPADERRALVTSVDPALVLGLLARLYSEPARMAA